MSLDFGALLQSTEAGGVLLRSAIGLCIGAALTVAADLAVNRATEGRTISSWWVAVTLFGQLFIFMPATKIVGIFLPEFHSPIDNFIAQLSFILLHLVISIGVALAAGYLFQQFAINIGRKLTGFPPEPIDWPYVAAVRIWLSKHR